MRSYVNGLFAVILLGLLLTAASGYVIRDDEDIQQQLQVDWSRLPDSFLLRWWRILNDDKFKYPSIEIKERLKRSLMSNMRPNLSINDQIEVLRNRLMLEMNRRRTQYQIDENKKLLESIGKRRKRHAGIEDDVEPSPLLVSKVTDKFGQFAENLPDIE